MELLERLRRIIAREGLLARGETVVVGVSGGPDSLCLLHVLNQLRREHGWVLHVAHLNHCLRGTEADADAEFVTKLAQDWELPVTVESADVALLARQRKQAIEETARQVRYAFLARVAARVGAHKVAVAHNADDQVETVLMHWLRGAGLAGLRGMQSLSRLDEMRPGGEKPVPDSQGLWLIRPLLEVPRREIEAYCAANGLQPRFDLSNLDTTYYRNRLRHELVPFLETFNPRIREVILRSSTILTADYDYLRAQAEQVWANVTQEGEGTIAFDLKKWRGLPLAMQRSTIREAIHRLRRSLRNINRVHVEDAVQALREGTTGMLITLPHGLQARLDYDQFVIAATGYRAPLPDMPIVREPLALRVPGQTALPGSEWLLVARVVSLCGLGTAGFDADGGETLRPTTPWQACLDVDVTGQHLTLRPRQSGDRFWPQGLGDKPTTVNGFMTNAKVPRAWRDLIPLLASPTQVLWVAGWRIDERAKVTEETSRVLVLTFEKSQPLSA